VGVSDGKNAIGTRPSAIDIAKLPNTIKAETTAAKTPNSA